MIDAEMREKVIRGLECCLKFFNQEGCPEECPYRSDGRCYETIRRDALALLKEQEPRVMTWDELMRCADGDPAFIEASNRNGCWVLIYPTYMGMNDKDGYGVRWRYWTSRPTPEQMRETKWKEEAE